MRNHLLLGLFVFVVAVIGDDGCEFRSGAPTGRRRNHGLYRQQLSRQKCELS